MRQTPTRRYRPMDWAFSLIPDISLATANKFYTSGWFASFAGATITAIGVIFLMWGTRVRDHDFEANIANLHDQAAASEVRAKELEQRNLTLQRDVERERIERIKLEERVAPRRLTGEQIGKISGVLSASPPLPIAIVSRLLDPEGDDFANDLERAFTVSRWQVVRVRNWTQSVKGVLVAAAETTPLTSDIKKALGAALGAANIPHSFGTIQRAEFNTMDPHVQPHVLYLLIGAKP